jgi:acyl-homoserine lactone acylase PvdQ
MRAANSDLYDISTVRDPAIKSRNTIIKTRFWFDIVRRLRTSRFGSIISDSPLFGSKPGDAGAALIGYQATDEVGSLLKVLESQDRRVSQLARRVRGSPQNFLCADSKGNICHVLATVIPKRLGKEPRNVVLDTSDAHNDWL